MPRIALKGCTPVSICGFFLGGGVFLCKNALDQTECGNAETIAD